MHRNKDFYTQKVSNKTGKSSSPYFEKAYEIKLQEDILGSAIIDNNIPVKSVKTKTSKQLALNLFNEKRFLVAMTESGILWRWELETGTLVSRINCLNDDIKIIQHDNSLAVDIEDLVAMIDSNEKISDSMANCFSLSKDGSKFVLVLDGNKLATYCTKTGKSISRIFTFEEIVSSLVKSETLRERLSNSDVLMGLEDPYITNDGKYVVTYIDRNAGVIIDLKKQLPVSIFNEDNTGFVDSLDRDILYICTSVENNNDSGTFIKKQDEVITKIDCEHGYLNFLTNDNKYLLTASCNADKKTEKLPEKWKTVWFANEETSGQSTVNRKRESLAYNHSIIKWDIKNSKIAGSLVNIPAAVSCLNVSRDNKYLVGAFDNGYIQIYDFKSFNTIQSLNLQNSFYLGKLRISNDMEYISTQSFKYLTVWKNQNAS